MENTRRSLRQTTSNSALLFLAGAAYLFQSHGNYFRDLIWFLPILFMLACTHLPSISVVIETTLYLAGAILLISDFFLNDFQGWSGIDLVVIALVAGTAYIAKRKKLPFWLGAIPMVAYWLIHFFSGMYSAKLFSGSLAILEMSGWVGLLQFYRGVYWNDWFYNYPSFKGLIAAFVVVAGIVLWMKKENSRIWMALSAVLFFFLGFPFKGHAGMLLGSLFVLSLIQQRRSVQPSDLPTPLPWQWVAFLATRIYVYLSMVPHGTDVGYYRKIAGFVSKGMVPYVDFPFEYPPLSLLPMSVAHFLGGFFNTQDFVAYRMAHSGFYFLCELVFFIFLRRQYRADKISKLTMWLYLLGGLILGELLYDRLDLFFAMAMAVGVYFMVERKFVWSFSFLWMAVLLKLVSVILMPVLLIQLVSSSDNTKAKLRSLGGMCAVAGVSLVIMYGLFGWNYLEFLKYHLARGIQIESLWASLTWLMTLLVPQWMEPLIVIPNFGALHLHWAPRTFVLLSTILPVVLLLMLYGLVWLRRHSQGPKDLKQVCFLIVLIFMSLGKVFSPQFMIWILCLVPFCEFDIKTLKGRVTVLALLFSFGVTAVTYRFYGRVIGQDALMWALLALRNFVLIGWAIQSLKDLLVQGQAHQFVGEKTPTAAMPSPGLVSSLDS